MWDSHGHGGCGSLALLKEAMGMVAVAITCDEHDAASLRHAASRSRDADAARLCGMDRQTLRDWVHRYNE